MSDKSFVVKNGLSVNGSLFVVNTVTGRIGVGTSTPAVILDMGQSTDTVIFPTGNTGQRPIITANGMLRYNVDIHQFEGFANGGWGAVGGAIPVAGANQAIQFNDSTLLGGSLGFTFDKSVNNAMIANQVSIGAGATNTVITSGGIASGNVQFTRISGTIGANVSMNTTSYAVGTTVITDGQVAMGNSTVHSTINATAFTGQSNTALSALTANNSTFLNGQAATYYVAGGNLTGSIPSAAMSGTNPSFASVGVGVAAPGSSALYVYGIVYSYSYLQSAGNIYAAGDVYASYSDIRLKDEIEYIDNGIADALDRLNVIRYYPSQTALDLGAHYKPDYGLIAQEVEELYPELVGEGAYKGFLTIRYDRMVPLLVAAIKELRQEIASLKKTKRKG